jgi:hypothetical protein
MLTTTRTPYSFLSILQIKLRSKKIDAEITANRPVVVAFTEPQKFMAHFEFEELEKL